MYTFPSFLWLDASSFILHFCTACLGRLQSNNAGTEMKIRVWPFSIIQKFCNKWLKCILIRHLINYNLNWLYFLCTPFDKICRWTEEQNIFLGWLQFCCCCLIKLNLLHKLLQSGRFCREEPQVMTSQGLQTEQNRTWLLNAGVI